MTLTPFNKLKIIKIIHTLIWIFYNVLIFYMLYAVLKDRLGVWFWVAWGFVLAEGIVLALFKWTCPLTIMARRYTSSQKDNFDIYLPNWLAKHTKTIYTAISVFIIFMTLYRLQS